MSGEEIRAKITENNNLIDSELNPAIFTLNKKIEEALKENAELRRQCKHSFDELGYCIYCDTKVD